MLLTKRSLVSAVLLFCMLALVATDAWAAGKSDAQKKKEAQGILLVLLIAIPSAAVVALGGLGLMTAYRATVVRRSDLVAEAARRAPVKTFVLGLANTALLVALMAASGEKAPPVAAVLLMLLSVLAFVGLAAKSENLGVRIARAAGYECNPIIGLVIGWPTAVCILLAPVVGWCVFAYLAVSGVGAAVLSFFPGKPQIEEVESLEVDQEG